MKKINKSSVVRFFVFCFLSITISQAFFINNTHALFPSDRSAKRGYFSDHYFDWNNTHQDNVLPIIGSGKIVSACTGSSNGDGRAIPACIDSVNELLNLLKSYNTASCPLSDLECRQKRTGSAFIVYTMLGVNSGNHERKISSTQWSELEARLNSSTIVWGGNVSGDKNTIWRRDYSGGNVDDVVWYSQSKNEPGIATYDTAGNIAYRILRVCANPLGNLAGIPPPPVLAQTWSIDAVIGINSNVAVPGSRVTWTHNATVSSTSTGPTTVEVNYGPTSPPGYDSFSGDKGKIPVGTAKNKSGTSFTSYIDVPVDAAPGTEYCRKTKVYPKSPVTPYASQNSNELCATVADVPPPPTIKWSISPKIRIVNNTVYPGDTITWEHWVRNSIFSDDPTNLVITFGPVGKTSISYINTFTEPINLGVNDNGTKVLSTYDVPVDAAPGTEYCRRTKANPMSSKSGLPVYSVRACSKVVANWDISVKTKIKSSRAASYEDNILNAQPSDLITWQHVLNNNGPNSTNVSIKYDYKNDNNLKNIAGGNTYGVEEVIGVGFLKNKPNKKESKVNWSGDNLIIKQEHVGNTYCRSTIVDRMTPGGASLLNRDTWHESNKACFTVPYNYTLEPHVTVGDERPTASGTKYVVTPKVVNTGPTKSKDTEWRLTKFVKTAPSIGLMDTTAALVSAFAPASYPGIPTGTVITVMASGTTVFNVNNTGVPLGDVEDDSTLYGPGTRVCYMLSVNPYSSSDARWRHSAPVCISIGKKPKVQVWGGDVWSKGGINMLTTLRSNKTYGSWAEYALFSKGFINNMASKSMFNPVRDDILAPGDYSPLSFTNHDLLNIGEYTFMKNIPNISANFSKDGISLSPVSDVDDLSGTYRFSGATLTLNGGEVGNGKTIIINAPNADINIAGNINYSSGDINGIKDIPQLLIIAKNIYIDPAVTNIDAWLVAVKDSTSPTNTGIIDTCNVTFIDIRLAGDCSEPLRINGPVIAKKILLKRTYGSDAVLGYDVPAEIINFRADAYLWAAAQAAKNNTIRTVYSIEQPPRF